ncbi:hypothetical protein B0H17DRAFT_1211811 [Mycena rosella]|uniref:Uncharacterized protein n=1 Tax=Mycena rosella TaxID=1033263 RepID=A0AAD7CT30_MYCRO|nr:hypothetical protein B0H17DRAFT_1211811 [Mycena rosella]
MPKTTLALSAHASRNLTKPASQALATQMRADNNAALTERFKEIFAQREEDIETLARDYHKTENYIRQVLENNVRYTKKRAPSLKNAIVHELSKQARENGEDSNVRNVDISGAEYNAYKASLSEEKRKELIQQLEDYRDLKEHGVRATNKAVAMDAMQTSHQAGRVLINLHLRTGTRAFAMFTRGATDDAAVPCWVDSDESHLFFSEVLGISVYDLVCKFELWSCNRNKGKADGTDLDVVRRQITEGTEEGLVKLMGIKNLKMAWTHYKVDIVHEHSVELAGWPENIPIARPSKLPAEVARLILSKLKSGGIHWPEPAPAPARTHTSTASAAIHPAAPPAAFITTPPAATAAAALSVPSVITTPLAAQLPAVGAASAAPFGDTAAPGGFPHTTTFLSISPTAPASALSQLEYDPDWECDMAAMGLEFGMPLLPRAWSEDARAANDVATSGWRLDVVNREDLDDSQPTGFVPGLNAPTAFAPGVHAPTSFVPGLSTAISFTPRFNAPTAFAPGINTLTAFTPGPVQQLGAVNDAIPTSLSIPTRVNAAPDMGSSMSVFSAVTNTSTRKRKRAEGGGKSTHASASRAEKDNDGAGAGEQPKRKKRKSSAAAPPRQA